MEEKMFGKFPIFTVDIPKNQTNFKSVKDFIEYFKNKIDEHPVAAFIAVFDHFNHTKKIGVIDPTILDVQNIVFCFGPAIPTSDIVAVRPRAFGVVEFADKFTINFMEAPAPLPNQIMQSWVEELLNN